jgi:hypothetical protein
MMDRLISMLLKMVVRHVMNKGINAGINHVAGKDKSRAQMTPEERDQAKFARQAGQRARQAANIARKLMR